MFLYVLTWKGKVSSHNKKTKAHLIVYELAPLQLSSVPSDLQGFHGQKRRAALEDLEVQGDSQLRQKVKQNFDT